MRALLTAARSGVLLGLLGTACGGNDPDGGGLEPPPPQGALAVQIAGLPEGVAGTIQVTGPAGFARAVTTSEVLTGLTPGAYTVAATGLQAGGHAWEVVPPSQVAQVLANQTVSAPVHYAVATGALTIMVSGLPAGVEPALTLSGPGGYVQAVTGSATFTGLVPGAYALSGPLIVSGSAQYAPALPGGPTVVTPGITPQVIAVSYARLSGNLAISVTGLPAGLAAAVSVAGPGGFAAAPNVSTTLNGLDPGEYAVTAAAVTHAGHTWTPVPPSQSATVVAGATAAATLSYTVSTGGLTVVIEGLPAGQGGSVVVTGPDGFSQSVTATQALTGLVPGAYVVTASAVGAGGQQYTPAPAARNVTVPASTTPVLAAVTYALATGAMTVNVAGLPAGAGGAVTVTGPGGFTRQLSSSTTLGGLAVGTYAVTAQPVVISGQTWAPAPPSQNVTVAAGATAALTVTYSQGTGSLTVTVTGLPGGTPGNVTVTGPGGFLQSLQASATLDGLVPGSYTISASPVSGGGATWAPSPSSQARSVTAGATASASIAYASVPTTGSLAVTVTGLPGGAAAAITVTGPGGYSAPVTTSTTLSGLAPGSYVVAAQAVTASGQTWTGTPASQNMSVTAGGSATATVAYSQSTGSLAVTVLGLPGGTAAAITVTGPAGYSAPVTASATLTNLVPGSYTVAASSVTSGGTTYVATPATANVSVSAGATASATVTYTGGGGGSTLNLRIDGVYLTQAAQRYDGTVPLVAGRDAYLRVFAVANEANAVSAQVRVRLYSGTTLVQTWTLNAPATGAPTAANEGSLTASWNVLVPAAMVQPNLRVLADVDPANAIAEANEGDNLFPASGVAGPVDVRTLPTFAVRFVPVLQQVNGLQGDVTDARKEQFLADPRKLLPIGAYDADVRAAYTTTAPVLQSGNGNGAWGTILSEVLALRTADASTRYYYGVVKTSYSSGVAGIGYVGGGARTALGWDYLPSGSGVMAHEVGHNMGRNHAPCGGAGNPDAGYPHAGGRIGVWGLDVAALALKNPANYYDLMGYCNPDWVSDYNWNAMVTFRQGGPNNSGGEGVEGQRGGGLLVWGRITADGPVLEPAFAVGAGAGLPPAGPHRVEALAPDGTVIFSLPFAASETADLPSGREEAFAFVVPAARALRAEIAELRVVAAGRTAVRRPLPPGDPGATLSRDAAGRRVFRWNAAAWPMALVRDAGTGRILSFARGGEVRLAPGSGVDVTLSNGTVSRTERR